MKTDPNCIFCKIVAGEIPSHKIYEDKDSFVFLDIHPESKGHTLVVPKKHEQWWLDQTDTETTNTFQLSKKIGQSLKEVLDADFIRLNIVGTDVPHVHIHLIPLKFYEDKSLYSRSEYLDGEAEDISFRVSRHIKANL